MRCRRRVWKQRPRVRFVHSTHSTCVSWMQEPGVGRAGAGGAGWVALPRGPSNHAASSGVGDDQQWDPHVPRGTERGEPPALVNPSQRCRGTHAVHPHRSPRYPWADRVAVSLGELILDKHRMPRASLTLRARSFAGPIIRVPHDPATEVDNEQHDDDRAAE